MNRTKLFGALGLLTLSFAVAGTAAWGALSLGATASTVGQFMLQRLPLFGRIAANLLGGFLVGVDFMLEQLVLA